MTNTNKFEKAFTYIQEDLKEYSRLGQELYTVMVKRDGIYQAGTVMVSVLDTVQDFERHLLEVIEEYPQAHTQAEWDGIPEWAKIDLEA